MMLKLFWVFIFWGVFSNAFSASCLSVDGENVSEQYLNLYEESSFDHLQDQIVHRLQGYTVIVVPGISLDLLLGLQERGWPKWFQRPFKKYYRNSVRWKDYREFFSKNNIPYKILDLKQSELSIAQKSLKVDRLIELIATTPGPLIILTQSKGGIDLMDALLKMKLDFKKDLLPDLDRIKGMVFVQVPFQGIPLAEIYHQVTTYFLGDKLNRIIRTVFGFDRETAKYLGLSFRGDYLRIFNSDFQEILDRTGLISFSSFSLNFSKKIHSWILRSGGRLTFKYFGLNSDGLVPCGSAWPGSKQVVIDGVDHAATVMALKRKKKSSESFDRLRMALALFSLMFEDMDAKGVR